MANTFTASRVLGAAELTRMAAAIAGTYMFPTEAGGAVTSNGNMAPSVAAITAGWVVVNGTIDSAGQAGATVTVSTAHATLPRRDLIYYEPGVGFGVTDGVAALNPALPNLTSGRIAIYEVYVAAGDTSIDAGDLIDRRANINSPFEEVRRLFRGPKRKLLGEFSAVSWPGTFETGAVGQLPVGVGFTAICSNNAGDAPLTNALLEGYTAMTSGGANIHYIGTAGIAVTAPNKNPRLLIRWFPGASNASLTVTFGGFFQAGTPTAASAGAFLRATTTGNLFFVTDQGGTETATDLGARPTSPTSYEIYTEDAGVTWICRNTTTGAVVATHTTNVPTATTGLSYGIGGTSAAGDLNVANVVYARVEAASVA